MHKPYVVTLELGYPSSSFYKVSDPKNSAEVLNTLEKAGKLINKLTIADIDSLPHSMKGYELYSWQVDKQWHFTLLTGTNRNKMQEEIISGEDSISEAGWVNVHSVGVDAVKSVLSKLPQGEFVTWLAGMREPMSQPAVSISLPNRPIIQDIKEYAIGCGLNLRDRCLECNLH